MVLILKTNFAHDEFSDPKSLPDLPRIPGLRLAGKAFADALMVHEFLRNFGETLGFGEFPFRRYPI